MFNAGKHTYKTDLELGQRYRDRTTGLEGHLIAVHLYEHACERGTLRFLNGQGDVVESTFDAPELVHIATGEVAKTKRTGGPDRAMGARSVPGRTQ